MAGKTERIAALEERVEELEALMADPITLLTEALKSADAATLKSFLEVMNGVIAEHVPAGKKAAKVSKEPKEKKPTSNKEGPSAWNAEVKEVEESLVAVGKSRVKKKTEDLGEDEFNYDLLLKEASVRKIMREKGLERKEAEALAAEKTAAKEGKKASKAASEASSVRSAPSAPKPAAKAAAPKVKKTKQDEAAVAAVKEMGASDEDLAELATLGIFPRYLEDMPYYVDDATGEVFQIEDGGVCGSRMGVYNKKTGVLS